MGRTPDSGFGDAAVMSIEMVGSVQMLGVAATGYGQQEDRLARYERRTLEQDR